MTSIDKMSLRGIRAFSPDKPQTICFHKPLTLIVGPNGSGKTTIIEALKMAATGELPPNCKSGQAFINDPALRHLTETKAQIRLKFDSAMGKPTVVVRSFSLTQKAAKREYKAFEQSMQTYDDTGQKTTLSYRCADLNRLIPDMMGVSAAVLESVVFVHQEDSLWPLAEDKVLKERFDSIFASTKFTKALEEINRHRKTLKQEEKVAAADAETADARLTAVRQLREQKAQEMASLEKARGEAESARNACNELQERSKPLEEARELHGRLSTATEALNRESGLVVARAHDARHRIINTFGRQLRESTEELRAALVQISYGASASRHEALEIEKRKRQAQVEMEDAEAVRDRVRTRLAEAEAARDANRTAADECARLIRGLAARGHPMPASAGGAMAQLDAKDGRAAAEALRRTLASAREELAQCKARHTKSRQEQVERLLEVKSKLASAKSDNDARVKEQTDIERRQHELQEQLDVLLDTEASEDKLRGQASKAADELSRAEAVVTGALAADVETPAHLRRQIADYKATQKELLKELQMADDQSERLSRMRQLRETKEAARVRFDTARDAKAAAIEAALELAVGGAEARLAEGGSLIKEQKMRRRKLEEASKDAEDLSKAAAERVAHAQRDVSLTDAQQRSSKDECAVLEAQLRAMDERFADETFDFVKHVGDIESRQRQAQLEPGPGTLIRVLHQFQIAMEETSVCRVCNQKCGETEKAHVRAKHDAVRAQVERTAAAGNGGGEGDEVRQISEQLRTAQSAAEVADRLRRLRSSELQLADKAARFARELEAALAMASSARDKVESCLTAEARVRDVRADVERLTELWEEAASTAKDADTSHTSMASYAAEAEPRAKEDIMADLAKCNNELEACEQTLDRKELKTRTEAQRVVELQQRKSEIDLKLAKVKGELAKKQPLVEEQGVLRARAVALRASISDAGKRHHEQRESLERLEAEADKLKARERAEVGDADERAMTMQSELATLEAVVSRLDRYAQAGGDGQFEAIDVERQSADERFSEARLALDKVAEDAEKSREAANKQEMLAAELLANIELRECEAAEVAKREEVAAHAAKVAQLPQLGGVEHELKQLGKELHAKQLEVAKADGAADSIRGRLAKTTEALRNPDYHDVDSVCAKKLLALRAKKLAIADLDSYFKALDRALVRFHQTKMEEVNRTAKELWNKTYRGGDIDGIEVRSEHEGYTEVGNRKQSYRVVMRKGDSQLDMRGRCSAGQKVLACLIIRLALAESFCLHCGILALDEPTTNLDGPNSEAFAQSLHEIISTRKKQSNFQLVVITHDEDFVRQLGRTEYCENYYRLSKQVDENGVPYSAIEKVDIERFS